MFITPIIDQAKSRSRAQVQRIMGRLANIRRVSLAETALGRYIRDIFEGYKPSFQAHKIDENQVPDPQKYRDTWESARADVVQLFDHAKSLAQGLKNAVVHRELATSLIMHRIREAESRAQALELFSEGSAQGVEVMVIDFKDPSIQDSSLIVGKPAEQDTTRGVLTSAVQKLENRTSEATVVPVIGDTTGFEWGHGLIGTKSNGLPGNTHEVVPAKDTGQDQRSSYRYEFVGAEDMRINYGYILDQSVDTWFEYEAIWVPDEAIRKTKGYGWDWHVPPDKKLRWVFSPPPDGVLRLALRIRFKEPILANEIIIHPFIPPNEGAKPPVLKSVKVIDRGDTPNANLVSTVTQGSSGQWTLSFPSQMIQALDISFEQPHPYSALIGHWAFWRKTVIERTSSHLFGLIRNTRTRVERYRVNGEDPPITMLGVTEKPTDLAQVGLGIAQAGALTYAVGTAAGMLGAASLSGLAATGLTILGVGAILIGLFGSTTERVISDEIEVDLEAFDGKRWCIGIREIEVLSKVYEPTSMWASRRMQASGPIRSIRIDADERVPNGFPKKAIRYEVSIDDGETWYPISPSSSWDGSAPEILYVGAPEAIEGDPRRVGVIHAEPSSSIRLRIIMNGSESRPYESAQVERVVLWVQTGGGIA